MKKIVILNHKMNLEYDEVVPYIQKIKKFDKNFKKNLFFFILHLSYCFFAEESVMYVFAPLNFSIKATLDCQYSASLFVV